MLGDENTQGGSHEKTAMAEKLPPFFLAAALAAAMVWYAVAFLDWGRYGKIFPFLAAAVAVLFAAFACAAFWAAGARKAKLALRALAAVGLFCYLLFGVSAILNNVLNSGMAPGPRLAVFASFSLCSLEALWLLLRAAAPDWRDNRPRAYPGRGRGRRPEEDPHRPGHPRL